MWYVYILRLNNETYYKGCTSNLKDRLERHQKGWVESTRNFRPVELVSFIAIRDQQKAFAFEKYLKSGSGRAFASKHLL